METWAESCRRVNEGWEYVLWRDEDNRALVEKYAGWFKGSYERLGEGGKGEIYRADAARFVYLGVFGGFVTPSYFFFTPPTHCPPHRCWRDGWVTTWDYANKGGSVYADLDTECLRPYDELFERYNVSTAPHMELTSPPTTSPSPASSTSTSSSSISNSSSSSTNNNTSTDIKERIAFLARMGTDPQSHHSIPNAWMASTPGHPFWLLPRQKIAYDLPTASSSGGGFPEFLTGPIQLFHTLNEYRERFHSGVVGGVYSSRNGGAGDGDSSAPDHGAPTHDDPPTGAGVAGLVAPSASLDQHYASSPWGALYPPLSPPESVEVLPFWMVYPYSWQRDGDAYSDLCLVGEEGFNSSRCKDVLGVRGWGSWSLTYWGHSWNQGGGGNHLAALGVKEGVGEGEGKGEGEDPAEAKGRQPHEDSGDDQSDGPSASVSGDTPQEVDGAPDPPPAEQVSSEAVPTEANQDTHTDGGDEAIVYVTETVDQDGNPLASSDSAQGADESTKKADSGGDDITAAIADALKEVEKDESAARQGTVDGNPDGEGEGKEVGGKEDAGEGADRGENEGGTKGGEEQGEGEGAGKGEDEGDEFEGWLRGLLDYGGSGGEGGDGGGGWV